MRLDGAQGEGRGAGWGKPTPRGSVFANKSQGGEGARSLVVWTYMGWVNPRLKGWGCPISCGREEEELVVLTLYPSPSYLPLISPLPTL